MLKSKILLALLMAVSSGAFAQSKKIQRDDLLAINQDWRLIRTISGTYGIETRSGKTIVQPVYSKIDRFGAYDKSLALVKNISDAYGFIDTTGKEVIPAQYELKYIKSHINFLKGKFLNPTKVK